MKKSARLRQLRMVLQVLGDTLDLLWRLHPASWRPQVRSLLYGYTCQGWTRRRR